MAALRLGKPRESCAVLTIPEGVPTKEVQVWISLSIEYLKVIGPADRDDGSCCSIYGYIRVNDREKDCAPAVTLFDRRSRDEASTIILGDPDFQFLTLSDDASARPLWGGFPISIQMKLWEKLPQPEDDAEPKVEDPVIVDGEFVFDGMSKTGMRRFFEIDSNSGFVFYMAYANIFASVTVEVQFTINKDVGAASSEEEEAVAQLTGKRKHPFLIYGTIAATQSLEEDMPAVRLLYVSDDEPMQVDIGSPLKLDRRLVVAPASGGILGIAYTLFDASTHQLISQNAVPFCLDRDGSNIKAPESLTFTQDGDDGLVTISITLIPYKFFR